MVGFTPDAPTVQCPLPKFSGYFVDLGIDIVTFILSCTDIGLRFNGLISSQNLNVTTRITCHLPCWIDSGRTGRPHGNIVKRHSKAGRREI